MKTVTIAVIILALTGCVKETKMAPLYGDICLTDKTLTECTVTFHMKRTVPQKDKNNVTSKSKQFNKR